MVKKKTSGLRVCIAANCGERLQRAGVRYAKQYCEHHLQLMKQLRRLREPCRIIDCKNPSHEDGYCDIHRPFDADHVPFRAEWLEDVGRLKTNSVKVCPYSGLKPEVGTFRMLTINKDIDKIRKHLKGE